MSDTDPSQTLRLAVAEFFDVDVDQITPAFSLSSGRGQGSIARATLDASIRRRVGVRSAAVYSAQTFGELESALLGGDGASAPPPSPPPVANGQPTASIPLSETGSAPASCGVDLEFLDNLPETDDYWEHPFYQANFSSREIAECLHQPSPRQHFAARWCAKEALKKCAPALLREPMNTIEYVLEGDGPPYLARLEPGRKPIRLPHAVSLSHSGGLAAAVVVSVPAPRPAPPSAAAVEPPPPVAPAPAPSPRRSSPLTTLLALAALALAAWALARTFAP